MGFAGDKRAADVDPVQRLAAPGGSVGKQPLVGAPVQRHGEPAGAAVSDDQVHQAAAHGTATPSSSLPHLAAIQKSFGRHDVSGVQAHTGSAAGASAKAMGAQAFATGNHVVTGTSDLHTVAHEAAHVVQQRGGVQLKGGVGDAGDVYEQHADQVADAVVSGKSAEGLLDQHAGGGAGKDAKAAGGGKPAVQGYMRITRADFATKNVADHNASFSAQQPPTPGGSYLRPNGTTNIVAQTIATVGAIRVSADGKLAIEDKEDGSERQAKTFFIDAGLIAPANAELTKAKSGYQLLQQGGTLTVPDHANGMHTLVQVVAQHKSGSSGDDVTGPVNCDEMAAQVGGWGADHNKEARLKKPVPEWKSEEGHRVAQYVVEYAKKPSLKDRMTGKGDPGKRASKASDYATPQGRNQAEILVKLAPQRDAIAQAYGQMSPAEKSAVAEVLGINEHAEPKVGEAMVTFSTGPKRDDGTVRDHESGTDVNARWGQHWGGVVARSGGDYITLENYDRKAEDQGRGAPVVETRAFFQMYGNGPAQSWHAAQKATGEFPNAVSMPYGNKNADKT
ncbi:MAG TPA: DUF4157 domain-containing protein [Kofleriaceae bacterium]